MSDWRQVLNVGKFTRNDNSKQSTVWKWKQSSDVKYNYQINICCMMEVVEIFTERRYRTKRTRWKNYHSGALWVDVSWRHFSEPEKKDTGVVDVCNIQPTERTWELWIHRKYYITENQQDIDLIFTTISRCMAKLKIIIEMEIMVIMVTLLVSTTKVGGTPLYALYSWSYIWTFVRLCSCIPPFLTRIF